jgi:hypothetical protein
MDNPTPNNPFTGWLDAWRAAGVPAGYGGPLAKATRARVDAMGELARIGAETTRRLVEQQQDILRDGLNGWRDAAGKASPRDTTSLLDLSLETARLSTDLALRNLRELAQIAGTAQADMLAVLGGQVAAMPAEAAEAADGLRDAVERTAAKAGDAAAEAAETAGATVEDIANAGKLVE